MKPVKVMPKFKCDFCNYRSTRAVMELHEKRCYRNPNRFCDACENKGYTEENRGGEAEDGLENWVKISCDYCSKFDPKILKEIQERESKSSPLTP